MTENAYFKTGGVTSPIGTGDGYSALRVLDPALYYLLDFCKGVLQLHLGNRWDEEVTAMGRSDLDGYIVADALPYDPVPYMAEDQFKLPLLAAYRKTETYSELTTTWDHIQAKVDLLYVMPPFTAGQFERMAPFRTHVARTLVDRITQGSDQNYNSGQNVWTLAGVESINSVSCQYGSIPGIDTNLDLPAIVFSLEINERSGIATGNFEELSGIDATLEETEVEVAEVSIETGD
jgi:hypothetical protein